MIARGAQLNVAGVHESRVHVLREDGIVTAAAGGAVAARAGLTAFKVARVGFGRAAIVGAGCDDGKDFAEERTEGGHTGLMRKGWLVLGISIAFLFS